MLNVHCDHFFHCVVKYMFCLIAIIFGMFFVSIIIIIVLEILIQSPLVNILNISDDSVIKIREIIDALTLS